jgi:hypothetical protein
MDELKSKRLSPRLIQRASEILNTELARPHKAITPNIVRIVCDRLAEENNPVSPGTVMRACAHVESLRLGNMSTAVGVFASNRSY